MIGDAIALLDLLRGLHADRQVISTLFDWDGSKLNGSDRIHIVVHSDEEKAPAEWYYSIESIEGYESIRLPVHAGGVIESLGRPEGEQSANADFFRYIQVPDGLLRHGGPMPNVKVRFMVFAYKTDDLLSLGKGKMA